MGYSLSLTWKNPRAKTQSASTGRRTGPEQGLKSLHELMMETMSDSTRKALSLCWYEYGLISREELYGMWENVPQKSDSLSKVAKLT